MNPVVLRELRAEARRPLAHGLRLGVAGVFFVVLELALHGRGSLGENCRLLFPLLHGMLFVPSLLAGPVLLVDELSRERRQRTLELLLLTPLRASTVLHAKTVVFVARTVVLVMGALPVVAFTFLFGGVSPLEMAFLVLVHAMALGLSLSAGLVAACWGRTWVQAMALAFGLLGACVAIVGGALFAVFQRLVGGAFAPELWPDPVTPAGWIPGVTRLLSDADGIWGRTLGNIPAPVAEAWAWLLVSALLSTVLLAVVLGVLARVLLRRSLRLEPGPGDLAERPWLPWVPRASWWPAVPRVPSRVRRQWLRGNPLRWLMRYRGEVRTSRWAGAALMLAGHGVLALSGPAPDAWMWMELALASVLGGFLALASAGSFRMEREQGAWEMLLVSPLEDREFLWGRLGGLWWQFGPAWIAWAAGLALTVPSDAIESRGVPMLAWMVSLGACTPVIGLDAAFQFRGYRKAALVTLGAGVGASGLLLGMAIQEPAVPGLAALAVLLPVAAAAQCGPGFWLRLRAQRQGRHRIGMPRHPRRR